MNVRIFWVCAIKCMRAQTGTRFILSSEFVRNGVRTHVNSNGKIPSTGRLQGGSNLWCCTYIDDFLKYTVNTGFSSDKYGTISSKVDMTDTIKIYSSISVQLNMTFIQGHRVMWKLELAQSFCYEVGWQSPNICNGLSLRAMAAKKSQKCCACGSFEHLILFSQTSNTG